MAEIARPSEDYKRVAAVGIAIIVATFGIIGLWAAFAPLSAAVIGHGVVAVQSNRQTVQHFEGGIVRKILVREGDKVSAGQVLFELDPVQTNAARDIAKNQLYSLLVKSDRLAAERDNRSAIIFSPEVRAQMSDPLVAQATADETRQFLERRATISGQEAVLNSRIGQYRTTIDGMEVERKGMDAQVGFLNEEISGLDELYKQDLVPKPRILALERERAQLQGQIGQAVADKAKAGQAIGETELSIRQLHQQFYQDVSKDMAEVQTQLGDIRQHFIVAQDQAKRIDVTAPMSGTIQNLRVFTSGAVVRPGDPLVDIAPDHGEMIVEARFSPNDVDSVFAGQPVQVRFSSFHSRTIPVIEGTVRSISQDRLTDDATHQPYYMAIVQVPNQNLPPQLQGRLRAGLPADIMARTGSRTMLQYFWNPLSDALSKSMRER